MQLTSRHVSGIESDKWKSREVTTLSKCYTHMKEIFGYLDILKATSMLYTYEARIINKILM